MSVVHIVEIYNVLTKFKHYKYICTLCWQSFLGCTNIFVIGVAEPTSKPRLGRKGVNKCKNLFNKNTSIKKSEKKNSQYSFTFPVFPVKFPDFSSLFKIPWFSPTGKFTHFPVGNMHNNATTPHDGQFVITQALSHFSQTNQKVRLRSTQQNITSFFVRLRVKRLFIPCMLFHKVP